MLQLSNVSHGVNHFQNQMLTMLTLHHARPRYELHGGRHPVRDSLGHYRDHAGLLRTRHAVRLPVEDPRLQQFRHRPGYRDERARGDIPASGRRSGSGCTWQQRTAPGWLQPAGQLLPENARLGHCAEHQRVERRNADRYAFGDGHAADPWVAPDLLRRRRCQPDHGPRLPLVPRLRCAVAHWIGCSLRRWAWAATGGS